MHAFQGVLGDLVKEGGEAILLNPEEKSSEEVPVPSFLKAAF
jgi:hypothetical protein